MGHFPDEKENKNLFASKFEVVGLRFSSSHGAFRATPQDAAVQDRN